MKAANERFSEIKRCVAKRNLAMQEGRPLEAEYWRGVCDGIRWESRG